MSFSLPSSLDTIDLFGFYLPAPLIWAAFAVLPCVLLCWGLRRLGFYRLVWHRALFDMALYVIILGSAILAKGGGWQP
ncbi:MAG TPA: DUF1656 domain-containing protein [Verrucomicrobiae bacterium]|jgi:hypothetical protein|nr:DUF1656 domain-containing protein [Verrucomicrobiae bacterium]